MQEKTMVADTLLVQTLNQRRTEQSQEAMQEKDNGSRLWPGSTENQRENKELKQTLKQFRTACEQSQEELYQIAREKSYYVPTEKATAEEVAHVRSLFTQGTL